MKAILRWILSAAAVAFLAFALITIMQPVHAAAANGCKEVGTVGNVAISICIDDDTNAVTWANSAGMLAPVP